MIKACAGTKVLKAGKLESTAMQVGSTVRISGLDLTNREVQEAAGLLTEWLAGVGRATGGTAAEQAIKRRSDAINGRIRRERQAREARSRLSSSIDSIFEGICATVDCDPNLQIDVEMSEFGESRTWTWRTRDRKEGPFDGSLTLSVYSDSSWAVIQNSRQINELVKQLKGNVLPDDFPQVLADSVITGRLPDRKDREAGGWNSSPRT